MYMPTGQELINAQKIANQALKDFIPQKYASKFLQEFYEGGLLPSITNNDYEGEFRNSGDKVIIRKRPDVTIREYNRGVPLVYDDLTASSTEMVIDRTAYWGIATDDITEEQTDMKGYVNTVMDTAVSRTEEWVNERYFTWLEDADGAYNETNSGTRAGKKSGAYNLGTAVNPIVLTSKEIGAAGEVNVTDIFTDFMSVLKEQGIVTKGVKPYTVVPNRVINLLSKSELKRADITGDNTSVLRIGQEAVGSLGGMEIFETNFLEGVEGTGAYEGKRIFPVFFGTKHGVSFALQVHKMRKVPLQDKLGDGICGVNVYGHKVIEPRCVAKAYVAI